MSSKSFSSPIKNTLGYLLLGALLTAAVWIRLPYVRAARPFYNSDTSILDLMARHFRLGEWSFYYWNQGYYGVLDSIVLMPAFHWFGATPQTSQGVGTAGMVVLLILLFVYIKRAVNLSSALISVALLAVPPPFFVGDTFHSYCYIFGLTLGIGHLLVFKGLLRSFSAKSRWLAAGILAGVSFYYFAMILVFWAGLALWVWSTHHANFKSLIALGSQGIRHIAMRTRQPITLRSPWDFLVKFIKSAYIVLIVISCCLWVGGDFSGHIGSTKVKMFFSDTFKLTLQLTFVAFIGLFWRDIGRIIRDLWRRPFIRWLTAGFLIGYSPALIAMAVGYPPSSPLGFPTLKQLIHNFEVMGLIILPRMATPGSGHWLFEIAAWILFCASLSIFIYEIWRWGRGEEIFPIEWIGIALANIFLFTLTMRLSNVYQTRYFLPFYVVLVMMGSAAIMRSRSRLKIVLIPLVLLFIAGNVTAHRQIAKSVASPDPNLHILSKISEMGLDAGYADYWIAYHLTALSGERIILVPTGDNDRYAPYLTHVQSRAKVALIERSNEANKQATLSLKGVTYQRLRQISVEDVVISELGKV